MEFIIDFIYVRNYDQPKFHWTVVEISEALGSIVNVDTILREWAAEWEGDAILVVKKITECGLCSSPNLKGLLADAAGRTIKIVDGVSILEQSGSCAT